MARPRRKAAPRPDLEAMIDTIEESISSDDEIEDEPKPRRQHRQAGAKKVHAETTQIFGDGVAVGVLLLTNQKDTRKNLTQEESQSIGHPVIRMLSRRLPNWLKPLLPKTKLSKEDSADLEEILATIGKWSVRLIKIAVEDFLTAREHAQQSQKQAQKDFESRTVESTPQTTPTPAANGRANAPNPFDQLQIIDLGQEV